MQNTEQKFKDTYGDDSGVKPASTVKNHQHKQEQTFSETPLKPSWLMKTVLWVFYGLITLAFIGLIMISIPIAFVVALLFRLFIGKRKKSTNIQRRFF